MPDSKPFQIGGHSIAPGMREPWTFPSAPCRITRRSKLSVHVVHGRRPGPVMFVSAAIHGDEVIGVEIVRRLLRAAPLRGWRARCWRCPSSTPTGFSTMRGICRTGAI